MAKKPPAKNTVSQTRTGLLSRHVHVDVKVGILHTIADAIYSTPAGKIREAVANARDNGASWIIIHADRASGTLSLFDNGTGITWDKFEVIFKSIGFGLLQADPDSKLSYFGLGLMSIFQLGRRVRLFTRPRGSRETLVLNVDTAAIFDPRNKDESISFLDDCIVLTKASVLARASSSAPTLDDFLSREPFEGAPDSFTEIVVEGVSQADLDAVAEPAFEDELRKLLPLRVDKEEPFLKRFTSNSTRRRVLAVLDNGEYCKTIDVYFGVEGEKEIRQLWKYFPKFRAELTFPDDNVLAGVSQNRDFAYYVIHTVAEDFHRQGEDRETGFWVRNQNFLVKGAHFLEKPGPGGKIIQQPLRNWIFGEIFHKDMNAFLTVARNDYLYQTQEFADLRREVSDLVSHLNEELRSLWQEKDRILKSLVRPFAQFASPEGAVRRTEEKLRRLFGEDVTEPDFQAQVLEHLGKLRQRSIEKDATRIDLLLEKTKQPILLGEDETAVVKVDPSLKGKVQECQIGWDASRKRVTVVISPSLFEPQQVVFLGKTFTTYFVTHADSDPAVSVDGEKFAIYVNPFNKELKEYSVSMLDVYLALEIADAISPNKPALKKNFLSLLGPAPAGVSKYITPLGEDLRRTLRFARAGA